MSEEDVRNTGYFSQTLREKKAREKIERGISGGIIEGNFELEDTLKFDYNSLKFERTDADAVW